MDYLTALNFVSNPCVYDYFSKENNLFVYLIYYWDQEWGPTIGNFLLSKGYQFDNNISYYFYAIDEYSIDALCWLDSIDIDKNKKYFEERYKMYFTPLEYAENKLLDMTNIEFTKLYEPLYSRPLSEIKFQGYIYQNLTLTKNNVAYIKLTDEIMKKFEVDSAAAGNMINDLKFVNEILVWVFFSEDTKMKVIKANIRSRGPIINEIASNYGGGGHPYASGVRLTNWQDTENLIKDLDEVAKEYLAK